MVGRVVQALLAGVIAFLVALLAIFIISAIIPWLTIDASFWAGIIGLLVGLGTFFGRKPGI